MEGESEELKKNFKRFEKDRVQVLKLPPYTIVIIEEE